MDFFKAYSGVNVLPLATVIAEPNYNVSDGFGDYNAQYLLSASPRANTRIRNAMNDHSNELSVLSHSSCSCADGRNPHNDPDAPLVWTFELDQSYLIDAVLVLGTFQDKGTLMAGGFDIHVGESNDYSANPKCNSSPFLACPNGGCNNHTHNWKVGFEAWCGL